MTNVFITILFLSGHTIGGGVGGVTTIEFPNAEACQKALQSIKSMKSYQDAICIYSRTGYRL